MDPPHYLERSGSRQRRQKEERVGSVLPVVVVTANDSLEREQQDGSEPQRSAEKLFLFPQETKQRETGYQPEIGTPPEVNVEHFALGEQRRISHAVLHQVAQLLKIDRQIDCRGSRQRRG